MPILKDRRLKYSDLKIKPIEIIPYIHYVHSQNTINENAQEVYRVMLNTYKERWLNRYGITDEGIWSGVLAKVTMKQIRKGFDKLSKLIKDKESKFRNCPPNPWEFLDMCAPAANQDKF
jgi:hypothetical protein